MSTPKDWQDKKFSNEDILSPGFPDLRGGINQFIADQLEKFYAVERAESWVERFLRMFERTTL